MISILIPIYNDPVLPLVENLRAQCLETEVPFEIICLDDHSSPACRSQNDALQALPGVRYLQLDGNIGRSRIRNRLAELAQFPYLLFMDGDSRVIRPDYIEVYLRALHPQKVIYGGRVYSGQAPADPARFLHWHYGCQREALAVAQRNAAPYRTFMTNNFLVPKNITGQIRFDESIRRYGYEDTIYALELKKAGIEILHLDNPLEHLGLEKNTVFLQKTADAVHNLRDIRSRYPELDTRLLKVVRQLQRLHLAAPARWMAPLLLPVLKRALRLSKMPLWILDLYKLFYFFSIPKP